MLKQAEYKTEGRGDGAARQYARRCLRFQFRRRRLTFRLTVIIFGLLYRVGIWLVSYSCAKAVARMLLGAQPYRKKEMLAAGA